MVIVMMIFSVSLMAQKPFAGNITFKNAQNLRDALAVTPRERILVETDAPFLAPVPMRGNPNEPAFLAHTCAFVAQLRGVSAEDFAARTFANAEGILG